MGKSLGGAVATYAAHKDPSLFSGLILENTFTSIADMTDHMFPFLSLFKYLVLRIDWDSNSLIRSLDMPILFIGTQHDEIVPEWHTEKLNRNAIAAPYRRHVILTKGGHNDSWYHDHEKYKSALTAFLLQPKLLSEFP